MWAADHDILLPYSSFLFFYFRNVRQINLRLLFSGLRYISSLSNSSWLFSAKHLPAFAKCSHLLPSASPFYLNPASVASSVSPAHKYRALGKAGGPRHPEAALPFLSCRILHFSLFFASASSLSGSFDPSLHRKKISSPPCRPLQSSNTIRSLAYSLTVFPTAPSTIHSLVITLLCLR